ncbi:MAG: PEFG-CTERM sorting domain-containing protein [Nitrosopumilus sp.]|uniref:PEFG-CTERM sorting domain-containing protein n=1 Tax=Nitrosopumilus sp. TaxID=2024843 RepID=UPI00242F107A|nr:PEFG-CTERM sorting domain-containing protein [Nitrosopumilus sp.]MCV0366593.1 PEFG-CTERM sorting domain-containing protein [Nitrosopumilus sp.]
MRKITTLALLMTSIILSSPSFAFAESVQEKSEFASSLEETLGHFWALEQNLDDKNAELALIHATHPISELYDSMKPQLKAADPALDAQVQKTLMDLKDKANTTISRAQAQQAIDDAKGVVAIARSTIVGDELSDDSAFKVQLMKVLLDTSIAEYGEAVSDGVIGEMAEFQDGSAFVWRSQQIFAEIESDIDAHIAEEIDESYENLWNAYDAKADPSEIQTIANRIIHELDESQEPKIEFASSLEETLGHFWALEQNLDDKNAELALIHATHPISELYDSMKPQLKAADPALDAQVQKTLMDLKDKANTTISRAQAQQAIDDAKGVVAIARSTIVGDELSDDSAFKVQLMKVLLDTSIAEYGEAVSDGVIGEMAEFQDGSAFVWRSQQIFAEIESDIDAHIAEEIDESYEDLWNAYDARASPLQVETLAGGIIHEIDEVLGVEDEGNNLLEYVETIEELLDQTKQEYAKGDNDLALSLATKAYLDNYEFLEAPLIELGQRELMEEVEVMLREELRGMIRNGEPVSEVNAQIDAIQAKMKTIGTVVPEFGTIAMMVLVVAITSIIAITAKSRINLRV